MWIWLFLYKDLRAADPVVPYSLTRAGTDPFRSFRSLLLPQRFYLLGRQEPPAFASWSATRVSMSRFV